MPEVEGEVCDICWDDEKKEALATHFIGGTPLCAEHHAKMLTHPGQRFSGRKWCREAECSKSVAPWDGEYCPDHSVKAPTVAPVRRVPITEKAAPWAEKTPQLQPAQHVTQVTQVTRSEPAAKPRPEIIREKETPMSDPKTPRSVDIARGGIRTGADFSNFMSAIMADLVEGKIEPAVANAACKAGNALLQMLQLQMKERASGKILKLSDGG